MSTQPEVTTYVKYLYPGALCPEESSVPVTERDPEKIAREADPAVFAFSFYDVTVITVEVGGEDTELRGGERNPSPLYYIDAEKLTADDVAALPGDHSILLSNMRGNGWDVILRCRAGNFRPIEDGDVVISSGREQVTK